MENKFSNQNSCCMLSELYLTWLRWRNKRYLAFIDEPFQMLQPEIYKKNCGCLQFHVLIWFERKSLNKMDQMSMENLLLQF